MRSRWILEGDREAGWVRVWAPAKVNLFLQILRRLPSGYHEIRSLMIPVTLADEIYLTVMNSRTGDVEIQCDDSSIPIDHENLAHKACYVLRSAGFNIGSLSIHIRKKIPVGAGLGGGSSDAAAVMKGIDYLSRSGVSREELCSLGLKIGADVPFFFMEQACLVSGIGDALETVNMFHEMWLVIGFPGFAVSTKRVYDALDSELTNAKAQVNMPISLEGEVRQEGGNWFLINDLEAPVFLWYPFLKEFCKELKALGALEAKMTGSGSSIFGVFKERAVADAAMSTIQKRYPEWKLFLARPVWQSVDESWRNANGSDRG